MENVIEVNELTKVFGDLVAVGPHQLYSQKGGDLWTSGT